MIAIGEIEVNYLMYIYMYHDTYICTWISMKWGIKSIDHYM